MGVWYDCFRCNKQFGTQEKANEHINKCVVGVSYDSLCDHHKPKYITHGVHK